MKKMSRMMALMVAVIMCMAMALPAMAAPGDFTGEAETTINASHLVAGDTVEVYQLVKWDAEKSDWALNGTCGVELKDLLDGIDEAEAIAIAVNVSTEAIATLTVDAEGNVSYNCEGNPGLFYLKAIPGDNNKDTIYNPAIVSADYYEGGNVIDFSAKIGNSVIYKRCPVPFDKEIVGADKYTDTKPGDVIPYRITTEIPSYGTTYTAPVFTVSDTLSAGLTLKGDVTVAYGAKKTAETNDDVKITKSDSGFKVEFQPAYLIGLDDAERPVEITYSAEVTAKALRVYAMCFSALIIQ